MNIESVITKNKFIDPLTLIFNELSPQQAAKMREVCKAWRDASDQSFLLNFNFVLEKLKGEKKLQLRVRAISNIESKISSANKDKALAILGMAGSTAAMIVVSPLMLTGALMGWMGTQISNCLCETHYKSWVMTGIGVTIGGCGAPIGFYASMENYQDADHNIVELTNELMSLKDPTLTRNVAAL